MNQSRSGRHFIVARHNKGQTVLPRKFNKGVTRYLKKRGAECIGADEQYPSMLRFTLPPTWQFVEADNRFTLELQDEQQETVVLVACEWADNGDMRGRVTRPEGRHHAYLKEFAYFAAFLSLTAFFFAPPGIPFLVWWAGHMGLAAVLPLLSSRRNKK